MTDTNPTSTADPYDVVNHRGETWLDAVACEIASEFLGRVIQPHELNAYTFEPVSPKYQNTAGLCRSAIDLAKRIEARLER